MRGETMKDKSKKSTYSTTFGVDPKKTDLEDRFFLNGAGYEVRTHNLDLGKVALCQLS